MTPTLLPLLTRRQINNGHPADRRIVMSIRQSDWGWMWAVPYYQDPMWLHVMTSSLEFIAAQPPGAIHLLPVPELARGGNTTYLREAGGTLLADRYLTARQRIADKAQNPSARPPRPAPPTSPPPTQAPPSAPPPTVEAPKVVQLPPDPPTKAPAPTTDESPSSGAQPARNFLDMFPGEDL